MASLEVYYCIDMDVKNDDNILYIERCLKTYIEVNYREYELTKFERYSKPRALKSDDVIKNGLYTFNRMYIEYKMKKVDKIWFVYISNGDIKASSNTLYKNICLVLLNDNPIERECYYVINNKGLKFEKEMTREDKLEEMKKLNKCLQELFETQQVIKY
jgi:hypothetical protein